MLLMQEIVADVGGIVDDSVDCGDQRGWVLYWPSRSNKDMGKPQTKQYYLSTEESTCGELENMM